MTPKEILVQWIDCFNASDAKGIVELYAENAVIHQVANAPIIGKTAIYEMFENEFATAKMVCIVENMFEDGRMGYYGMERPSRTSWMRFLSYSKR